MRSSARATITLLLLGAITAACGGELLIDDTGRVTGDWNGAGASLRLDATGGEIEFDCAHGALAAPTRPDRSGSFDVPGVFVREHGGPIRIDEVPDSLPARYLGRFLGRELTLRLLVAGDTLGPMTLVRNGPVRLIKCL